MPGENGLLNLQADVREYVPEYPAKPEGSSPWNNCWPAKEVSSSTTRSLTSIRMPWYNIFSDHPQDYDPVAAIDIFKDQALLARPGTQFNYSTFSFNLLAAVIERAVGMPYETYVDSLLIQPMQLPICNPNSVPCVRIRTSHPGTGWKVILPLPTRSMDTTTKTFPGNWVAVVIPVPS